MIMKLTIHLVIFFCVYLQASGLSANPTNTLVVPDVTGIKADQAKARLESKGFRVEVVLGEPASSQGDDFKVYAQSLAPLLKVERGQTIILTVFDTFISSSSGNRAPQKETESEDPLEAFFGILEGFQKADDKKRRIKDEQNNETTGHSIRGDERPPEPQKPNLK